MGGDSGYPAIAIAIGTEVSAKYRGAFCEAKVKDVKPHFKVKVTLIDGKGSITVNHDCVRSMATPPSSIQVSHSVQVRGPDGQYVDGVVARVSDSSLYTVVFDDGDIKSLRRGSLCLKGDRHFNESETLDHLPLTDPENFGAPVMQNAAAKLKPRKRGRPSAGQDDSEEERVKPPKRSRQRSRQEKFKVVLVETGRRTSVNPAIVLPPELVNVYASVDDVASNQRLVRLFKDGKFVPVMKDNLRPFDPELKNSLDAQRSGMQAAITYIETGKLPWDMAYNHDTGPSEDDRPVAHASSLAASSTAASSASSSEKDTFISRLKKVLEKKGTPLVKAPSLCHRPLDLHLLHSIVSQLGGYDEVTKRSKWRDVLGKLNFPPGTIVNSNGVKSAYSRYLVPYEEAERGLKVAKRVTRSGDDADEGVDADEEDADEQDDDVEEEEDEPSRRSPAPSAGVSRSASRTSTTASTAAVAAAAAATAASSSAAAVSSSAAAASSSAAVSAVDDDDEEDEDESDENDDEAGDADVEDTESAVGEEEDDEESTPSKSRVTYDVGSKVRVRYGRGRNLKLYEAKVIEIEEISGNAVNHFIHYAGWNTRYDEWVPTERIVGSAESTPRRGGGSSPSKGPGPSGNFKNRQRHSSVMPPSKAAMRSPSKTPASQARSYTRERRSGGPPSEPAASRHPHRKRLMRSGLDLEDSDDDGGSSSPIGRQLPPSRSRAISSDDASDGPDDGPDDTAQSSATGGGVSTSSSSHSVSSQTTAMAATASSGVSGKEEMETDEAEMSPTAPPDPVSADGDSDAAQMADEPMDVGDDEDVKDKKRTESDAVDVHEEEAEEEEEEVEEEEEEEGEEEDDDNCDDVDQPEEVAAPVADDIDGDVKDDPEEDGEEEDPENAPLDKEVEETDNPDRVSPALAEPGSPSSPEAMADDSGTAGSVKEELSPVCSAPQPHRSSDDNVFYPREVSTLAEESSAEASSMSSFDVLATASSLHASGRGSMAGAAGTVGSAVLPTIPTAIPAEDRSSEGAASCDESTASSSAEREAGSAAVSSTPSAAASPTKQASFVAALGTDSQAPTSDLSAAATSTDPEVPAASSAEAGLPDTSSAAVNAESAESSLSRKLSSCSMASHASIASTQEDDEEMAMQGMAELASAASTREAASLADSGHEKARLSHDQTFDMAASSSVEAPSCRTASGVTPSASATSGISITRQSVCLAGGPVVDIDDLPPGKKHRYCNVDFGINFDGTDYTAEQRIQMLQDRMAKARSIYSDLKSEMASIDRKQKKRRSKNSHRSTLGASAPSSSSSSCSAPGRGRENTMSATREESSAANTPATASTLSD